MTSLEDRIANVRRAKNRVQSAQRELEATMAREFPAGAAIMWRKREHLIRGFVVGACFGDRLHVRNSQTGAVTKISAHDIARALSART